MNHSKIPTKYFWESQCILLLGSAIDFHAFDVILNVPPFMWHQTLALVTELLKTLKNEAG